MDVDQERFRQVWEKSYLENCETMFTYQFLVDYNSAIYPIGRCKIIRSVG